MCYRGGWSASAEVCEDGASWHVRHSHAESDDDESGTLDGDSAEPIQLTGVLRAITDVSPWRGISRSNYARTLANVIFGCGSESGICAGIDGLF